MQPNQTSAELAALANRILDQLIVEKDGGRLELFRQLYEETIEQLPNCCGGNTWTETLRPLHHDVGEDQAIEK